MKQKIFELSEEDIRVIEEIKENVPGISSNVGALRYLIRFYIEHRDYQKKQEEYSEKIMDFLKQMKITLSYTEKQTEVAVEALNTLLCVTDDKACVMREVYKHPAIHTAEATIKKKVEHNTQRKNYNKRKKIGS